MNNMFRQLDRIGIVGGLGPDSTVDYYKGIINTFRKKGYGLVSPEILIYSCNMAELFQMVENHEWEHLIEWLVDKVSALQRAGAQFAVIGANTPHIVFDEVSSRVSIPMVSIIDATCRHAQKIGIRNTGLLGTKFTMESDFYKKTFEKNGMLVTVPSDDEIQLIHDKLIHEIELGIIKDETREKFLSIVKRMVDEESIDSLILGCTELPMILTEGILDIPFLNTTAIHIESVVEHCLAVETFLES